MTQDERWKLMWTSVMCFFKEQQRRPSKYKPEEHDLRNWVKYNIQRMRRGDLPADRQQRMKQLIEEGERLRRVNQYCYSHSSIQHNDNH